MTPRERLLNVLSGQPTDRAPAWLLFPYHPTSYYVDVRTHPMYRPVAERAATDAVTLNRRGFSVPLFAPDVEIIDETVVESNETIRRNGYRFGSVELVAERRSGADGTKVKRLLETDSDLDAWLSLPVETDPVRIRWTLDGQLPNYLKERDEFPLETGAMMLDLGEPVGPIYGASNLEMFAIWSATRSDDITAFLDQVMVQKRIVYDWCLEKDMADVYFLVGSELAAPPLVGLKTFKRWIVPYAKELIERIHANRRFAIQHFHGQIKRLLPYFVDMAPDGLHTIESPPVGDCELADAFEIVGDRIALIGNIQYDDFRAFEPERMKEEVRRLQLISRGRRFILSPTAGPFDPSPPVRLIENYHAFLDAANTDG